jgi:hypothetical protein
MKGEEGEFVAYAYTRLSHNSRGIRLVEFLLIDSQGNAIADGSGDITIGFYEGRISHAKVKEAVKSFSRQILQTLGLSGGIMVENISLRDAVEIERLRARTKCARYDYMRGLQ